MIEILFDITTFPSYQTIYYTVLLALIVKQLFDWNIHLNVKARFFPSEPIVSQSICITTINLNVQKYYMPILHWICKNIRKRTKSRSDDPEKPFPSIFA